MRDIIEVIGQWMLEWFIETVVDFAYGTKTKPPRIVWVYFLRVCLIALAIYCAVGLYSTTSQPTLDYLTFLYPDAMVGIAIFTSLLLPIIVAMGEHRLGRTVHVWIVVIIWVLLATVAVYTLLT